MLIFQICGVSVSFAPSRENERRDIGLPSALLSVRWVFYVCWGSGYARCRCLWPQI